MKAKYYVFDMCCLLLFQQVSADLNYRFLSVHFLKALSINVALPRRHLKTLTLIERFLYQNAPKKPIEA